MSCGFANAACCLSGQACCGCSTCMGGACVPDATMCPGCGTLGEQCCPSGDGCGGSPQLSCINGCCMCIVGSDCGGKGQACCDCATCAAGLTCSNYICQ
jgi:hypothetical protein